MNKNLDISNWALLLKEHSLKIFRKKYKYSKNDVGKELLSFVVGTLATNVYQVYGKKLIMALVYSGDIGEKGSYS